MSYFRISFILVSITFLLSSCAQEINLPVATRSINLTEAPTTPIQTITISSASQTWTETSKWNIVYETINGISVPPYPDPTINNATLAGVDLNGNGIRDDVERYLAKNTDSKEDYDSLLPYARYFCQLSRFPTTGTIEDVAGVAKIVWSLNISDIEKIRNKLGVDFFANVNKKILNTEERNNRYNKVSSFMFNPESAVEAKKCVLSSTIFGISIPPEPSSGINDDTLLWVDSNNNGVRDDVERMIACNVINMNDYLASLEIAKAYGKMLSASEESISQSQMVDLFGDIACAVQTIDFSKYPKWLYSPERDITRSLLNTKERLNLYRQKTSDFGGVMSNDLKACTIKSYPSN